MSATFRNDGKAIDYTPGTAKTAGDVVIAGKLIGVVKSDIAANELGSLHVCGEYDVTKKAGDVVAVGDLIYYDDGVPEATISVIAGKLMGRATQAAAGGDATVRVLLEQDNV